MSTDSSWSTVHQRGSTAIENLIERSGATPVSSIEDLERHRADIWESDEELDAFVE